MLWRWKCDSQKDEIDEENTSLIGGGDETLHETTNKPVYDKNNEMLKTDCVKIYYESGDSDLFYEISDKKEIERIVSFFSEWDMEDNTVPDNEILDLICIIRVEFSDDMNVYYGLEDITYRYGMINNQAYYLPDEFCRYIDRLIMMELDEYYIDSKY